MHLSRWFMILFFLVTALFALWTNIHRPTILVLHSYSNDYVWTREVNVGLDRALANISGITVHYHFMKTKRFRGDEAFRRAGIAAREAIERENPDVILAVDDYAQKLAAQYYVNHPTISIVFAGINGGIEPYGYDQANNVTGILERKPARALNEVIESLARQLKIAHTPRARYIADDGYSSHRDSEYLEQFDWRGMEFQKPVHVDNFPAWQEQIKRIAEQGDFILVGGYRKLLREPDGDEIVPASEVASWTEANASVPVIGMNVFNTEDGTMLSVGVSPYEQGEVAAGMAIRIIRGETASNIPIQQSSQYVVALRESAMLRRQLELPQIYEAFARATENYFP